LGAKGGGWGVIGRVKKGEITKEKGFGLQGDVGGAKKSLHIEKLKGGKRSAKNYKWFLGWKNRAKVRRKPVSG